MKNKLKTEVIKDAHLRANESMVWSSIVIKVGEATREAYMNASKLVDTFEKAAEEYNVTLDTDIEAIYQDAYKQAAEALWLAEMFDKTESLEGPNPMRNQNIEGYYQAAKQVLKEADITPSYTKEDFLNEGLENLTKDIFEAQLGIKAGVFTEDDPDYQAALAIKETIEKEMAVDAA